MRYANEKLILDEVETEFLSMVAMRQIAGEYPASELMGSLAALKEEAETYIRETAAKQDPDKRDPLKIKITGQIIDLFDVLGAKGHEAIEAAGDSIRWQ